MLHWWCWFHFFWFFYSSIGEFYWMKSETIVRSRDSILFLFCYLLSNNSNCTRASVENVEIHTKDKKTATTNITMKSRLRLATPESLPLPISHRMKRFIFRIIFLLTNGGDSKVENGKKNEKLSNRREWNVGWKVVHKTLSCLNTIYIFKAKWNVCAYLILFLFLVDLHHFWFVKLC